MERTLSGCGIGLRREHYEAVLSGRLEVPWFEVISENFMVPGGRPLHVLERVRADYPVALHGVSLSIGSAEPVSRDYLARLKSLVEWVQPAIVSDHLCWTGLGGHNSHDLLPLPFTGEAVRNTAAKVRQVQDTLGRPILLENVSSYVEYHDSEMAEWEFVAAVAEEADCFLLLDVNNVYVNARNHGVDPFRYLEGLPAARIRQFHLAGHEDHREFVIDTHDAPICDPVWALFRRAVERFGPRPALIERDANIPPLEELLAEARRADAVLEARRSWCMPERRRLRAVQLAFLRGVLNKQEGVPEGLRRLLRTPPAGSTDARWHVYAHGFLARLVEAIENDYSALSKVLGAGPLRSLTARYVSGFPPRSYDLGRFGDRLPAFLETDALTGDLPFLPDLARLEWAVAEASVAPDVPEVRWADLALLGPEAATEAPLALRPGAALVSSIWPILEIWSCRDQPTEAVDVPLSRAARTVLVSRRGIEIVCRPAASLEVLLFRATESGGRLADVLDDDAERVEDLVGAFRALVDDGVFARPLDGSHGGR